MTRPLVSGGVRRLLTAASLLTTTMLLLASCGTGATGTIEAVAGEDLIVIGRPTRADLAAEHRLMPDAVWIGTSDPRVVRVQFTAGAAPCTGVRLAVDEGPATVRVVLHAGTPPEGIGQRCTARAVIQEARFTLARPIGSRELIWNENAT